MPIAMGTDEGIVLVEALIEELRPQRIIAPALSTLERLAWETRHRAQQQVFTTLTVSLSEAQGSSLIPSLLSRLENDARLWFGCASLQDGPKLQAF